MGLFCTDRGSDSYEIYIHWRGLKITEDRNAPNIVRYAHWALQVGPYFYEIAAPTNHIATHRIREIKDRNHLFGAKAGLQDEERERRKGIETGSCPVRVEYEETSYAQHIQSVQVIEGDVNVLECKTKRCQIGKPPPLQISKVNDWAKLNHAKRARNVFQGTTRIKLEKIHERARHIFNEAFRQRYSATSYNCHAFVCYLLFSIRLLEHKDVKLNADSSIAFQKRNSAAAIFTYRIWKEVIGESIPPLQRTVGKGLYAEWGKVVGQQDPRQSIMACKEWGEKERSIKYDEIIPPAHIEDLLKAIERIAGKPRHRAPHKTYIRPDHSSYGSDPTRQAYHGSMQNQQAVMNNAVSTQASEQALQQEAQQALEQAAQQTGHQAGHQATQGALMYAILPMNNVALLGVR